MSDTNSLSVKLLINQNCSVFQPTRGDATNGRNNEVINNSLTFSYLWGSNSIQTSRAKLCSTSRKLHKHTLSSFHVTCFQNFYIRCTPLHINMFRKSRAFTNFLISVHINSLHVIQVHTKQTAANLKTFLDVVSLNIVEDLKVGCNAGYNPNISRNYTRNSVSRNTLVSRII